MSQVQGRVKAKSRFRSRPFTVCAMEKSLLVLICITAARTFAKGNPLFDLREATSGCGEWVPYKDEKCFKIASTLGKHTLEEAETACNSFGEELKLESYPRVITIATKEEQEFLQQWLFVQSKVTGNVWLGLKESGNPPAFKWGDGSNVTYTNWAKQNTTDNQHKCVELTSGSGGFGVGQWTKANCKNLNGIVCERSQAWSLEKLKNMYLDLKSQQEKLKNECDQRFNTMKNISENEINSLKKRYADAEKNMNSLKQKIDGIEKNIVVLKQRNEAEEKNISALEMKNAAAEKNIAALKQRNDASDKLVATLKQKVEAADKNTNDLKVKHVAAEKDIVALKQKNDASDKTMTALKQRNDAADKNINGLKQTVDAANKNIAALKQTNDATNQTVTVLKQKSDVTEKAISELKQKNVATDKNIAAVKQKSDVAEKNVAILTQKQAATDKEFASVKQKTDSAEKNVAALKQKTEESEKMMNDMKQKYSAAEKNVAIVKQKNEALEKTVNALIQKVATAEKNIAMLNQKTQAAQNEVISFKQNPVAVGFVYVELPGQQPPTTLWPQTKWTDVSAKYAGQFFRVVGGGSAPFGQIQEGASPHLEQVQYAGKEVRPKESNPINIPADGSWSGYIWDGTTNGDNLFLRFRLSKTEVRPRNQAVKVWQRIK